MNRVTVPLAPVVVAAATLGLALVGVPQPARAYCILPANDRWTPPPGPIPVYISVDSLDQTEIARVNLGGNNGYDEEVRWVKAALAIVNEASHDGPRLYYAGIDANVDWAGTTFWSSRQPGITISTYGPCWVQPGSGFASEVHSGDKSAIRFISPLCGSQTGIWWVDPSENGTPGAAWTEDFVGVLVHELLHALGLNHTNGIDPADPNTCDDDDAFSNGNTHNAVMNTADKKFRRRLRRDDVEGLRALWGEPERTPWWSSSTAKNPAPLSWTAPAGFSANLRVNTPVTLTSSSRDQDGTITMAFTDGNDVVRYLNGTWTGWYGGTGAAVRTPSNQVIVSYDRVVAARGRDLDLLAPGTYGARRLLVAWHGTDETTCCGPERVLPTDDPDDPVETRVWWKVHDGGSWHTPRYTGKTRYKELGVGYDPRSDMFVLVGVDTCKVSGGGCQVAPDAPQDGMLFVRTIRGADGSWACTQALSTVGPVLAVGDVSCDYRGFVLGQPPTYTRCAIPVTTVEEDQGPRLSFIEGEIRPWGSYTCFVRTVDPPTTMDVLATGTPSSAMDGYHTPAQGTWLLGAYAKQFAGAPGASGWAFVSTMARDGTSGYVVPPPQNTRTFASDTWPLAVGSLTRTFTPWVQWRVVGTSN